MEKIQNPGKGVGGSSNEPNTVANTKASTNPKNPTSASSTESYRKQKGLDYPVNVARWENQKLSKYHLFVRNIARQTVSTHFVFASDIELYPR